MLRDVLIAETLIAWVILSAACHRVFAPRPRPLLLALLIASDLVLGALVGVSIWRDWAA